MNIKRKICIALVILFTMVSLISVFGYMWITQSPIYELAKKQIIAQKRDAVSQPTFKFAWWKSWSFSDGLTSGYARFVICENHACYLVVASKDGANWKISSLSVI
jgi:hypothetical protein